MIIRLTKGTPCSEWLIIIHRRTFYIPKITAQSQQPLLLPQWQFLHKLRLQIMTRYI